MKNASKHAATLKSLQKKLSKGHKPEARPQLDPLRALVLGVLREDCDDGAADAAMTRLDEEFVDINELRVATELELIDLIGEDYDAVADRAVRMRELLMDLFDSEGRLSIDRIAALNKKEQRQRLRASRLMTAFVEGHLSLLGFGQSAIPVDETMRQYLLAEEAIADDADVEETQKFLEGQLKAEEYWPFYAACREASLAARRENSGRAGGAKQEGKPSVGARPKKPAAGKGAVTKKTTKKSA